MLTVGEMSQFAVHGGVIQFTLEEKQVHFEMNLDAAPRMELKIRINKERYLQNTADRNSQALSRCRHGMETARSLTRSI